MSDFHLDLSPLKEPLGFIKLLEWLFAVFTFASCGGYKGVTTLLVSCPGVVNKTITASFSYPFRLNTVAFTSPDTTRCNGTWTDVYLLGNFSSLAQFFVTFGVLIFFYCMMALVFYLGYMHTYRNGSNFPMIVSRSDSGGMIKKKKPQKRKKTLQDYVFTLCAVFLWLVSTAAWAKALVDIKISTGYRMVKEIPACKIIGSSCVLASVTSIGSLNVSVIFGLVNMILWGGNAWFVYKETSLHKPNNNSPKSGFYPPTSGI